MSKARFIRRISIVSSAIQAIDNEAAYVSMEITFVRLVDYQAKCCAKSSLFNFPNKSY